MRRQAFTATVLAVAFLSPDSDGGDKSSAKAYQVITPKDDRINVMDINARGEVTGTEWVEDPKDANMVIEAPFFAAGKEMTPIPLLQGYTSMFPAAVSDAGVVVGRASKPGSFTRKVMLRNQAFIWDAKSGSRGLGALKDDLASFACGITKDGSRISGYSIGDNRIRPCVWDRIGENWEGTPLPVKERLGSTVVALSDDGNHVSAVDGTVPCLWSRDAAGKWTREEIGGSASLIPRGVNNSGTVAGLTFFDGRRHGVIWSRARGAERIPEATGFVQSEANDVNNEGVVVGSIEKDMGQGKELEPHAFVYHDGRLELIVSGGPNFTAANTINDRGQISGTFERDEEEEK